MMFCRFLFAAVMSLAACQSAPSETSVETLATATAVPASASAAAVHSSSVSSAPFASAATFVAQVSTAPPPTNAATTRWLETEMNDVQVGMWRPDDWESDAREGLVVAEPSEEGILVYVFVPSMSEFAISTDVPNYALSVLNQVAQMPIHNGRDAAVSEPMGFEWDSYQAAYYMISTGDGVRILVLALAIPNEPKVVVCTISTTTANKMRIREALPWLLDGLMIDGTSLRGESLSILPDPLPFPRYHQQYSASNNEATVTPP
jgi:hypothetical protein